MLVVDYPDPEPKPALADTPQSQPQAPMPPAIYPAVAQPRYVVLGTLHGPPERRARHRFILTFILALIVWFLIVGVVDTFSGISGRIHHHFFGTNKGWPTADDGHITVCRGGDVMYTLDSPFRQQQQQQRLSRDQRLGSPPLSASTSYELPLSSKVLFFLSRGSSQYGGVEIDNSGANEGSVTVDVTVGYWRRSALERANICNLERNDGEVGVGVFTPTYRWGWTEQADQIEVFIKIHLPKSSHRDLPLIVNGLETDFSIYHHTIKNLHGNVFFQTLDLKTTNAYIHAESIDAVDAKVQSSNGRISGSYNVTKSIDLRTSNAGINVELAMENHNQDAPTSASIRTSNAKLEATLSLYSGPQNSGSFDVSARTSNSALNLEFQKQPINSTLTVESSTSNSPADLVLHPAYEGTFSVQSSLLHPRVEDQNPNDPSGEGRLRHIEMSTARGNRIEGRTYWGNQPKEASWVRLETSNSPARLAL